MLRGPTATNEPPLELCLVLVHEKELSQQDIGLERRTCGRKMGLSESHSEVPALPPPSVQSKAGVQVRREGSVVRSTPDKP